MTVLSALFNLLALLYIFRGAQILLQVRNEWQSLHEEPLTRAKKSLAENAAFFIAVPPSVLVHELCHAAAVLLFGGQVVGFTFMFFLGEVAHVGVYTNWQRWFISLAGTLGSLAVGITIYLIFRHHKASSFRFFALRTLHVQIMVSLIFYPIITIFMVATSTAGGDWATIYDFSATPILSGITAVLHIATLILFFIADRNGRFEMPAFPDEKSQNDFLVLQQKVKLQPHDTQEAMRYIALLQEGDAPHKARHELQEYLKTFPNAAEGWLTLAWMDSRRTVSPKSKGYVDKAMQLGVSDVRNQARIHLLLGRYYLDKNNLPQAMKEIEMAFRTAVPQQDPEQQARYELWLTGSLYFWRSQVYRRQEDFAHAQGDIQNAIHFAQLAQDDSAVAYYREQQATIENHAKMIGKAQNRPS